MPNTRQARVADQIKEIVARMITYKLKDPRIGMVTVTDVRVTGDLQHATVYYTVYGDAAQHRDSARALESAKGFIRSTVGKQLGLRLTPTVEFALDEVPVTAQTIEDALAAARAHDEQVRALAQGKTFAGDADPYKKPREAETDREAESDRDTEDTAGAESEAADGAAA